MSPRVRGEHDVVHPEPPTAHGETEFSDFPPPPPKPQSRGRVFGGGAKSDAPSTLPKYKQTMIIGPDGSKEVVSDEPPAPPAVRPDGEGQPAAQGGEEDQGAPPNQAPEQPNAAALRQMQEELQQQGQEIIEDAQAQASEMIAEAQQMVEQAQMQANQIVQEAMAQAQQAAEEARQQAGQQGYEEGREAGLIEGRQAGESQLHQMIEALKFQFVDLVRLRRKVMLDMESEIVKLSWEVARRVVGEELKSNREVIVGVVRSAVATLGERDEIVVRVNPSEFEAVKGHQKKLEAMVEGLKKFVVQADGAIEPGSCSLETNLGNVDARIETQFEAIRQGLDELCEIRSFERQDQVDAMPVEVPGDPDFEQRMKERGPQENQEEYDQDHEEEYDDEQQYEEQQEMELLPEPTEELFAQLTPEQQQEYLEAYQQQQAYLEHMHNEMMQQQEMELLPEPTEELFATLTPEEQQQYMEAYQQQQAWLEQQGR